jgi:hypothetical protein
MTESYGTFHMQDSRNNKKEITRGLAFSGKKASMRNILRLSVTFLKKD